MSLTAYWLTRRVLRLTSLQGESYGLLSGLQGEYYGLQGEFLYGLLAGLQGKYMAYRHDLQTGLSVTVKLFLDPEYNSIVTCL